MNKKSGSGLFLMEMIVVVFFFILCASTCILVFAKANSMSRLARDINRSTLLSQSIAEVWKDEGVEGLKTHLGARESQGSYEICRGDGWEESTPEHAVYRARVTVAAVNALETADISVEKGGEEIFALEVSRYLPDAENRDSR